MTTADRFHAHGARGARRTAALLTAVWFLGTLSWWSIAFPPLRQVPPAWLARLQEVCFGTEAAGLPKLYGWGALVAGPAGFALIIAFGWGRELRAALAYWWRGRISRAALSLALSVLAAEAAWAGWQTVSAARLDGGFTLSDTSEPFPENYPRLDFPLPDFRLLDRSGRVRTASELTGRIALLTFAYGHCSTVCPATVSSLRGAALRLGDLHPAVVIITLDAWRDTPSALAAMARKWELEPDALLLSGKIAEVERVLDEFRVARTRDLKTGEIDHASLAYVVDADGRIAYGLSAPSVSWLEAAARRAAIR